MPEFLPGKFKLRNEANFALKGNMKDRVNSNYYIFDWNLILPTRHNLICIKKCYGNLFKLVFKDYSYSVSLTTI